MSEPLDENDTYILEGGTKYALLWRDINYEITEEKEGGIKEQRIILDNLNGYCESGELTAIMGPSGAGN